MSDDDSWKVLEHTLFGVNYTPRQLAYLNQWACCAGCCAKPETVDPLPAGWVWDCVAFTVWAWCPKCDAAWGCEEESL